MSDLSKRTLKYYVKSGLKNYGIILAIEAALALEWILIGFDEENLFEYVTRMSLMIGGLFTVLLNGMYSLYGPNWYDSLVLSMGARRKDIFWGQIIKQLILIVCNSVLLTVLALIIGKPFYLYYIYATAFMALILGGVGLVVGHKIKRYGKIVVVIVAVIAGVLGGTVGVTAVFDQNTALLNFFGSTPLVALPIAAIVIYVALEAWAYKLNKTMMVR